MSSMGMNKSGTQTLATNVWVKLVNFVVRAGYPATDIDNHTLKMDANASGDVRFRGTFTSAFGTQQFRVVLNGTTVLGTADTGVTTTIPAQSVVIGDTLEFQGLSSSGFAQTVSDGAANTFLEFNQTTSDFAAEATTTTIGWGLAADADVDRAAAATATIGWGLTADVHVLADHSAEAATTIGWGLTADVHRGPGPGIPPPHRPPAVSIGVRTVDGRPVGIIPCEESTDTVWTRDQSEVSRCEITTDAPEAAELTPWLHWLDVWEDDTTVWSGPVHQTSTNIATGTTRIMAKDVASLMWYTRVPTTRRWSQLDPAPIAADLWAAMLELHRVDADPQVLPNLGAERFDVAVTADSRMLHQVMDDLVRLGLAWTVVAGRPVLGHHPDTPIAQLAECDFMAALERVRDGKRAANDVRVQGANWARTERTDMAGLHLQTLISLDDLRGVSNITAAARQYLREVGAIRDALVVPTGASLAPDAPVTTADLVPGRVFAVHAAGIAQLMRLKTVEIHHSPANRDVRVTLDAVTEPVDLDPQQPGGI